MSPVELLYDLVYVAAISQAAATMASAITATTVIQFAILFSLIWVARSNGSLWLEMLEEPS